MGSEERKIVHWGKVYRELAELLVKKNGEELYQLCIKSEEFLENHNWAKKLINRKNTSLRTGDDFTVNSFDPMQFFSSFNGFGMRKDFRIEKINIYFSLLGSEIKYNDIDFLGCPSPIMIALVSARNPDTQEELWESFNEIMKSRKDAEIDFDQIRDEWYGISIESFTVLLFWIDSKNFLPLDKNTLALFETNNKKVNFETWDNYKSILTKENTKLYQVIAKMAGNCNNELIEYKEELKEFGIEKCPNKSLKMIAIKPLIGCNEDFLKGLKENELYIFDKAYSINDDGTIDYHREKDIQLFNQDNLQININAIVGKNGTGKSTLVQLLLAVIHNIGIILKKENVKTLIQ